MVRCITPRSINEIPEGSIEKNEIDTLNTDEFDFNQDTAVEFENEYRSPGWGQIQKKSSIEMEKIKIRLILKKELIDGYLIPKNDEFFTEYVAENKDRLKYVTDFSGSYGFALLLKK